MPIIFNVKNYDLFYIDRPSRRYDAARHLSVWKGIGVDDPTPFQNVTFFAAQRPSDSLPVPTGRQDGVFPFSWSLRNIIERGLLLYLFADADASDANFGALALDIESWLTVETVANDGTTIRSLRTDTDVPTTLRDLLTWVQTQSRLQDTSRILQNHSTGTWRKLYRGCSSCSTMASACSGSTTRRATRWSLCEQIPLIRWWWTWPHWPAYRSCSASSSRRSCANWTILRQLIDARTGSNAVRSLIYLITLDELNRFAPKGARDPITELVELVAAEMRSQGIILLSAQQQASKVSEKVIENAAERAAADVVRAKTIQQQEMQRLACLRQVEGHPTCDYCGQELTPKHIQAEERRLTDALREAEAAVVRATALQRAADKAKQEEHAGQRKRDLARQAMQDCVRQATSGLANLPPWYRQQVEPTPGRDVFACLAASFPQASDLQYLEQEVASLAREQQERDRIAERERERERILSRGVTIAEQVDALEVRYPEDHAQRTLMEYGAAQQRQQDADGELRQLDPALHHAQVQLEAVWTAVTESEANLRSAEGKDVAEKARCEALQRNVEQRLDAVPSKWRPICERLTDVHIGVLRDEMQNLNRAHIRAEELHAEQRQLADREERLGALTAELTSIPIEARVPVQEIELHEQTARKQSEETEALASGARTCLIELTARQTRREELEGQVRRLEREARLYRELARLLGREYLQRHLLQQVEATIVAHANRVLDRISHGTLRLALRTERTRVRRQPKPWTLWSTTARSVESRCSWRR